MIARQLKLKAVIFDYTNTLYDVDNDKLYPEVVGVLKELQKRGVKLAVVSRAPNLEERLKEFKDLDLNKYFQVVDVVLRGETKEPKNTLDKLGVKADNCLVVGDRVRSEILEGNKIGCKTVWIRRGRFRDEMPDDNLEKPDYTINSLDELLTIDKISK